MEFENEYLERLIRNFDGFSVEGFNIFALGDDSLPHLICACPNRNFARAIQSLLTIAKAAQTLRALNAYVTSHCYLFPKVLADGSLGMVATVINDAVYVDGQELEYNEPELLLGTPDYENFVGKFLQLHEKVVGNE
jgi:hypothetical protein